MSPPNRKLVTIDGNSIYLGLFCNVTVPAFNALKLAVIGVII